ncbi:DsbA family protein [Varunaivibrio sulfuroxidans]|uniref:DSBA-like thioredoxin domain-containing protein n=1 Tax=Varunaivibrio sulfuroxidans TaxID=1773489 RepID=A0A4R3JF89_9PROT|nr:DsbA family protein [Varunaivibrio sulfuroxidans]TCS64789.1 putative protein-disulfide isomerase [Varunaivibrio sulfuroxidans]WES29907.1 DsbA family protein [Varunaivibrio sulfuroxidans]
MATSCPTPGGGREINPAADGDAPQNAPQNAPQGKTILVFADPMCSWCWGFAPVLEEIADAAKGTAHLELVMGGLRTGAREPWNAGMRDDIAGHWRHVHKQTGQPFDFSRFDDHGFVYDTLPACRAVVATRAGAPGHTPEREIAYLTAVQKAFYAGGRDVTKNIVLADIAEQEGYPRDAFLALLENPQTLRRTTHDFEKTRTYGVGGFPAVLCVENGQYGFLTLGYRPFAALAPLLDEWLAA